MSKLIALWHFLHNQSLLVALVRPTRSILFGHLTCIWFFYDLRFPFSLFQPKIYYCSLIESLESLPTLPPLLGVDFVAIEGEILRFLVLEVLRLNIKLEIFHRHVEGRVLPVMLCRATNCLQLWGANPWGVALLLVVNQLLALCQIGLLSKRLRLRVLAVVKGRRIYKSLISWSCHSGVFILRV